MPASHIVRFGVFELDCVSGELRRHGLKIRLPDQSFQILKLLLSRPGEVVTREELRGVLWTSETFVGFDAGLNGAVRKLRDALDDSADSPRFVETLPRRGYRFVASVSAPAAGSEPVPDRISPDSGIDPAPPPLQRPPSPSRLRSMAWRAAGLAILVSAAAAGLFYQRGGFDFLRAGDHAQPFRAVVVLPFKNLTGDAAQDRFADTVSDAVTVRLSQAAGLDVISGMSARHYKDTEKHPRVIAQELKVDGLVTGTVVRSAAGLGITVHLIRAATGHEEWAQSYEGDMSHMIALQQRIASQIAVAAGRAAPRPGGIATTQAIVPQAYDAYLKGMQAQGQPQYEGFRRATAYYEEAIGLQPDFAQAHAALAFAQLQLLYAGPLSPQEVIPKAETAARRALQLDDTLGRAHLVLGQVLVLYHWRREEGTRHLDRAAELEGGRGDFSTALTRSLRRRGRFDEAIAMAERGRKLDPLSLGAQIAVGTAYRATGQYDRAITELRHALEMSPGRPRVHFELGATFLAMGRLTDAIRELEIAARPVAGHITRHEAYLGYAYAAAGRTDEARAVLKELEAHRLEQYVSWFGTALIHDALGEKAPALAALQRAFEDRAVELHDQHAPFKTIASEPAFQAVIRQVGL